MTPPRIWRRVRNDYAMVRLPPAGDHYLDHPHRSLRALIDELEGNGEHRFDAMPPAARVSWLELWNAFALIGEFDPAAPFWWSYDASALLRALEAIDSAGWGAGVAEKIRSRQIPTNATIGLALVRLKS